MRAEIRSNETKEKSPKRVKRHWIAGLWVVTWVIGGLSTQAEILYDKEGIQLHGTARIVTYNAATCHVLEEKQHYEELKANDGQPLHVWRLDYSVHNRTGKALSYLRADFDIESEWPPCTNWSWEGQGPGQYPGHVLWADQPFRSITAPYGMAADEVMEEELYLIVFHTDEPSFERWSTHFTFEEAGQPDRRPGVPAGRPAPSPGSPGGSSDGRLPPEVRLDEYLMEAQMLSEEKDHKGALEALERIVALQKKHGLELPKEFPFRYAQTALAAGSYQAAMDSVNRYLSAAGREGKHYREALAVRVKSRRALRAPAPVDAGVRTDAAPSRPVQPRVREKLPYEPKMVAIPGGRFRMGCLSSGYCSPREIPVREVQVESFELGKYEVTFEEYDRFTAALDLAPADDAGWGRGRRPVINVTWLEALVYTKWLSEQTGKRYRLPTEAEWEYAARAGTVTRYSWGDERGRNRANCGNCGSQWDSEQTAPVGSFPPNAWGLHDMHGNVMEWVQDCWNESYRGAPPVDGSAWESGDCSQRVIRDNSWIDPMFRVSERRRVVSDGRTDIVGFRVARTIIP